MTRLGQAQNVFVPLDLLILTRAMFLAEHVVRILDPDFQLLETLQSKAPGILEAAMKQADWTSTINRLKLDAADAARDLPSMLSTWVQQLAREGGLGLSVHVLELKAPNEHIDRSANRLVLALITSSLFASGLLLMRLSTGPRVFGEIPFFAV
ncbi:hypothetical protein [Rhizobium giardinii]|uniref:hypothetical protein n=1 Tax=Rhizobium giardinii TaxID=56731 RepID=UPI003D6FCD7D